MLPPVRQLGGRQLLAAEARRGEAALGAAPGSSKAVGPAALAAVAGSSRGGGWAANGPASPWEWRAAQSHRARPEEAQEPSWGTGQAALLTMLRRSPLVEARKKKASFRCSDVSVLTWLGVGLGLGVGVGVALGVGVGVG